jgi:hypothetical protein
MPLPRYLNPPAARNRYFQERRGRNDMSNKARLSTHEESFAKAFLGTKIREKLCHITYIPPSEEGDGPSQTRTLEPIDDLIHRFLSFPTAFYRNDASKSEVYIEYVSPRGQVTNIRGGDETLLAFLSGEALARLESQLRMGHHNARAEAEPCLTTALQSSTIEDTSKRRGGLFGVISDSIDTEHVRGEVAVLEEQLTQAAASSSTLSTTQTQARAQAELAAYVVAKVNYQPCVFLLGDIVRQTFVCINTDDVFGGVRYSTSAVAHMTDKFKVQVTNQTLLEDALSNVTFSNVYHIARAALAFYCYGIPYSPKKDVDIISNVRKLQSRRRSHKKRQQGGGTASPKRQKTKTKQRQHSNSNSNTHRHCGGAANDSVHNEIEHVQEEPAHELSQDHVLQQPAHELTREQEETEKGQSHTPSHTASTGGGYTINLLHTASPIAYRTPYVKNDCGNSFFVNL